MTDPIVRSVEIGADPDRVFALLTEPQELVRWWPDAAELEPREGGRVRMEFRGGEAVVNGTVKAFDPPRALAFSWFPSARPDVETEVAFTVTPLGDGRSRLDLVHSGWEHAPELRAMHDEGWGFFLGRLSKAA